MSESKLAHIFKKWAIIEPYLPYRKPDLSYILMIILLIENSIKS